jgi:general secretion pathway protein K
VLVVLALASSVVVATLDLSDMSIRRSQGFAAAGAARAILDGAEASAIAALRRDLRLGAEEDHLSEDWARIDQDEIAIEGGRFRLRITDAQARFNLNALPGGGELAAQVLRRIVAQADLPAETVPRIRAAVARAPLAELADLAAAAGLRDETVARLSPFVTVLPGSTPLNVNTMPDELFLAIVSNVAEARLLQGLRARAGRLVAADLAAAGIILPPIAGFRSDYFRVETEVAIDDVTLTRASLLRRRADPDGAVRVEILSRGAVGPSAN